jgi:hypothetical protein
VPATDAHHVVLHVGRDEPGLVGDHLADGVEQPEVLRHVLEEGIVLVDGLAVVAGEVRLGTGATNKNDPNDARSVAVAALRATVPEVRAEDHAAVMKVWAKRHRDLSRHHNRVACRLHSVLCDLVPGGIANEISPGQATRLLDGLEPKGRLPRPDTSLQSSSWPTSCASTPNAARHAAGSPPQ